MSVSSVSSKLSPYLFWYERDLLELGVEAQGLREKLHGRKTFFNLNRHINPTNICADHCRFCGFSAGRKNPHPYKIEIDEILKIADQSVREGARELHIVGAHNPECDIGFYTRLFSTIKEAFPEIHLKALTAAEVHFLSVTAHQSYEKTLEQMAKSGVDSMPGGGAEIFDSKIREYVCKGKVDADGWLNIHRLWHKMGKMSNCTMLFGHVEKREHRIDHMLRLRELQEETGGFNAFIPLVYQKENNYLDVKEFLTAQEILKTISIARLILDNISHIKAYWVTSTINLALLAQEFGADDLDGTIQKESINAASGAASAKGMEMDAFISLIKNSGFIPVERDSLYRELRILG